MNPRWVGGRIRFIPAYAGNSAGNIRRPPKASVHPRLRGELGSTDSCLKHLNGSSPLTRGTRNSAKVQKELMAVHPRLRGELSNWNYQNWISYGSSPLTRGTLNTLPRRFLDFRFIPAYAGNSLKQGIEHLTNSSKDFLSGKYAKNPETVLNHFKNSSLD